MPTPRHLRPAVAQRRILLAVTGLSPQVVTETLYALAVQRQPAWIPDEIHVVTTRDGARRIELALLSDDPGWFHRLRADYRLPPIAFSAEHVHLIRGADGRPLDDIRTPQDNEAAADCITELVRSLTSDPDTALHASIAGGRKTMGYYLGYAMSLFGREQDRLTHVLVSEPYESSWDFFYPTPRSRVIEIRDRGLFDTRDATVTLAEIPFVSLRHGLPRRLLEGTASYRETVEAARKAQTPPRITIDLAGRSLQVLDEPVALPAADLAFYAMMARRLVRGEPPVNSRWEDLADAYLREYRAIVGEFSGDYERAEQALAADDLKDWFEQRRSKTNRALRESLGEALAARYLIQSFGRRPHTAYGLALPREAIRFADGKLAGRARAAGAGHDG